jgi:hypothetical protein
MIYCDCKGCGGNCTKKIESELTQAKAEREWQKQMLERAKEEFELMCAYFGRDWQVVLHKNDVVPDAKKWLEDLRQGFEKGVKDE